MILSKFPNYADAATAAFQRVSLAYETLSKPASRKAYDLASAKNGYNDFEGDPLSAGELRSTLIHTSYAGQQLIVL